MQPCRMGREITCSMLSLQDAKHYPFSYKNISYIPNQSQHGYKMVCFVYKFLCFILILTVQFEHTVLNTSKCLQQQAQL